MVLKSVTIEFKLLLILLQPITIKELRSVLGAFNFVHIYRYRYVPRFSEAIEPLVALTHETLLNTLSYEAFGRSSTHSLFSPSTISLRLRDYLPNMTAKSGYYVTQQESSRLSVLTTANASFATVAHRSSASFETRTLKPQRLVTYSS